MAVFEYKGFDSAGKATSGIIDADAPKTARSKLRRQGVFPTEIHEQLEGATRGQGLSVEVDFSKYLQRVSVQDIATLTSQLSTLIGAGIPLVESLSALLDQVENPKLKSVLTDVREKVNEGASLADALASHDKVFDELFISMVRAGEQSGALDIVLQRLSEYTESQVELRGKLVSALTYPVLMILVSSGLVIGLFIFVIPRIRRVFDSFGQTLPFVTQFLLDLSEFSLRWWWLSLIFGPLAVYFYRRWIRSEEGRYRWDSWMLRIPIFGRINRLVAVSRFCRTLATLLMSGVPILKALGIVKDVVQNKILAEAIDEAANNIREGHSIAVPLRASGQFPPIVTHMISIGEKTGELETMLGKVADAYDTWVSNMVNTLTSLLTPILTMVMGGIVAFIAIAILLPMLNLSAIAR